jgi:hypothetical protein
VDGDWVKLRAPILSVYARMLPRLEAEEEMRAYRAVLAAGGLMMDERAQMQYVNSLERGASGVRRAARPTVAGLESMGISVVEGG